MADCTDRIQKPDAEALSDTVRRAAMGDDQAFAALAAQFEPKLAMILSTVSIPAEDVGDLHQEGLIGLYKAVLLYDPALSSFPTFATLCMRSGVADGLRKYRKDRSLPAEEIAAEDIPDLTAGPERILLGKEELNSLLAKIDSVLSPMERRVFGLHLQGKNSAQIASLLGKEAKSVENSLFRARRKLSKIS